MDLTPRYFDTGPSGESSGLDLRSSRFDTYGHTADRQGSRYIANSIAALSVSSNIDNISKGIETCICLVDFSVWALTYCIVRI